MEPEIDLFAELYAVEYKWPDCWWWKYGYIVYTNYDNDMLAAALAGIEDDYVLLYTDTLDPGEIEKNFDGLKVKFLQKF